MEELSREGYNEKEVVEEMPVEQDVNIAEELYRQVEEDDFKGRKTGYYNNQTPEEDLKLPVLSPLRSKIPRRQTEMPRSMG